MICRHPDLHDILLIEPRRFGDARGFFSETFREDLLAKEGFESRFVQDNHSYNSLAGTIRGLHFQKPPHAQDKLVRVVSGAALDVVVDIRAGSPTFGRAITVELSAENGLQILVPKGFAHGFLTRAPETTVLYKVTDYYAPDCDSGFAWNDPALGIEWKLDGEPLLSDKDRVLPEFGSLPADLFPFGKY